MTKRERVETICELLANDGSKTVSELAEYLGATEATVRRDLKELELQERIARSYGKARLLERSGAHNLAKYTDEHLRLAHKAVEFIQSGHVIILTNGTINQLIAANLTQKPRITVITNSSIIFDIIKTQSAVQLMLLGGLYSPAGNCLYGHLAETSLRELRADMAFFDPSGIDIEEGFTHDSIVEVQTHKLIARTARSIVLSVRSEVIGRTSGALIGDFSMVSRIVVDKRALPESYVRSLLNDGVELTFTDDTEGIPQ